MGARALLAAQELNLCSQALPAIRCYAGKRGCEMTPEAEAVTSHCGSHWQCQCMGDISHGKLIHPWFGTSAYCLIVSNTACAQAQASTISCHQHQWDTQTVGMDTAASVWMQFGCSFSIWDSVLAMGSSPALVLGGGRYELIKGGCDSAACLSAQQPKKVGQLTITDQQADNAHTEQTQKQKRPQSTTAPNCPSVLGFYGSSPQVL